MKTWAKTEVRASNELLLSAPLRASALVSPRSFIVVSDTRSRRPRPTSALYCGQAESANTLWSRGGQSNGFLRLVGPQRVVRDAAVPGASQHRGALLPVACSPVGGSFTRVPVVLTCTVEWRIYITRIFRNTGYNEQPKHGSKTAETNMSKSDSLK